MKIPPARMEEHVNVRKDSQGKRVKYEVTSIALPFSWKFKGSSCAGAFRPGHHMHDEFTVVFLACN